MAGVRVKVQWCHASDCADNTRVQGDTCMVSANSHRNAELGMVTL